MSAANPIANVTEYCIKIELKAHGSPHAYCLFRVQDPQVPYEETDEKTDEDVCQFMGKYVNDMI